MIIKRPQYIDKIHHYIDKNVIKVLTGIRRSGKSCLLKMVRDEILSTGVAPSCIIEANFESQTDESVRSIEAMMGKISSVAQCNPGKRLYLFFDEIQELSGWEKLVNGIIIDFDVDIYLTGSNAKLLSSELATYLGGRYVEINVFPLSFSEAWPCLKSEGLDKRGAFWEYVRRGGMPFIYDAGIRGEATTGYLNDLFDSIVLKDIAKRHQIRDIDLLERLIGYLISEISHNFSPSNLVKYLKHDNRRIGLETLYNYVEYCEEACFLNRVSRYDLVGKEILSTQEKLYLADHGFREAKIGGNERHIERVLENIVAIELLRRGWTVKVGKLKNYEVDFVATKDNDRQYVQVAYLMPDESTREREFRSLKMITGDNFRRIVLSLDEADFGYDGIQHQSLIDWCLDQSW